MHALTMAGARAPGPGSRNITLHSSQASGSGRKLGFGSDRLWLKSLPRSPMTGWLWAAVTLSDPWCPRLCDGTMILSSWAHCEN